MSSAEAAVVYRPINQVVGATADGLYVNVETGATYDLNNANVVFPGWDINPYGTSTTQVQFFWSGSGNGAAAGVRLNTVAGGNTVGTTIASLPVGFVISSALIGGSSGASFGNNGSATFSGVNQGKWTVNSSNYFGFRFTNSSGAIRYGYGEMQVGATPLIRTLLRVAYEDTGAAITVAPAPAPGPLPALGAAATFAWSRRLRQRLKPKCP